MKPRIVMNWFKKPKPQPMSAKDPMDWTLTPNSRPWEYNRYCPQCKQETTHKERMSEICGKCGYFDEFLIFRKRVSRQIWDGEKWVIQHKYNNGPDGYEISEL